MDSVGGMIARVGNVYGSGWREHHEQLSPRKHRCVAELKEGRRPGAAVMSPSAAVIPAPGRPLSRSHRHRGLVPAGYAGLFVFALIVAISGDDGTGVAFVPVGMLSVPWMLAMVVLDTGRSGSLAVVIFAGVMNTAILCAWAMNILSKNLRWAIAIGSVVLAATASVQ